MTKITVTDPAGIKHGPLLCDECEKKVKGLSEQREDQK